MNIIKKKYLSLFGLIILFSVFSFPQDIVEHMTIKGYLYSIASPSKNIDIITDTQIKEMGIDNISELFNLISSVNINRRGPFNSSFDFCMRGSNFEQVLILVNGIPFNNPQTGHFNSDLPFSVQDIKQVEVLKGGNIANYGSGAFAGAINIILKKTDDLNFTLTGGENALFKTNLAIGKKIGDFSIRASIKKNKNDGFYDGQELDNFHLNTSIHYLSSQTFIDIFGGYNSKDFGASGFYAPYPSKEKTKSNFIQFHFSHRIKNIIFNIKTSFSNHDDDFILDRYNPDFYHNTSRTYERLFNFSTVYKGIKIQFNTGMEYKYQKLDSLVMNIHTREIPAFYLNISLPLNYHKGGLDQSFRVDFFNNQDPYFTFYSGIHYNLSQKFKLKFGISKTIRFPSFTELYYNSPANQGDEFLKPEESLNLESVLSCILKDQSISLSLFYRNQQNLIDWIKTSQDLPWQAKNIKKNNIFGFELSHKILLRKLDISTSLEKIFSDKTKLPFFSKYGLRFPDLLVKVNIFYPISNKIVIFGSYCYKNILNSDEQGHFLNLNLRYQINKKLSIKLNIDNLFNTRIEEIPDLLTSGRWVYISILYN